jgi:hypothetical protein
MRVLSVVKDCLILENPFFHTFGFTLPPSQRASGLLWHVGMGAARAQLHQRGEPCT